MKYNWHFKNNAQMKFDNYTKHRTRLALLRERVAKASRYKIVGYPYKIHSTLPMTEREEAMFDLLKELYLYNPKKNNYGGIE